MINKKDSILLLVKSSAGELDWILPVLFKLSKKHNVYTHFKSINAYNSLKNNYELFSIWKKINKKFFIENSYKNFIYKIIRKLFISFHINKRSSMMIFLDEKIHNINDLKNFFFKNKDKKNFFKFVFSEHFYLNAWIDSLTKNKERSLVVHYPHSPFISFLKKPRKAHFRLNGDLLLLSGAKDLYRWTNYISPKKIKSYGTPKYEQWWIEEMLKNSKLDFDKRIFLNKKNFIVTIPFKPLFEIYPKNENVLKKQLFDLMDTLLKFPKIKIIFKIHPRIDSQKLEKILEKYNNHKNRWILSKSHLYSLANISDLFLCDVTSTTILEGIALKVPAIQFWPVLLGSQKQNEQLIKSKLAVLAKNKYELEKMISGILSKKDNKKWINQGNSFKSTYSLVAQRAKTQGNTQQILRFLDHEYDKIFN